MSEISPKCTPETVLRAIAAHNEQQNLYAPTLQSIADVLGVTRQRVEQITKALKANGQLQNTKELLLPGHKPNNERVDEEILSILSSIRDSLNGRPPLLEELLSYRSLPNSTVTRTVKRLKATGKIRDRRFLSLATEPDYTEVDHFWSHVDNRDPFDGDQCMPWMGDLFNERYGRCRWEGKPEYAHRVVYLITHGELPSEDKWVTITCGNAACCNPRHVQALTPKERMVIRDADRKVAAE